MDSTTAVSTTLASVRPRLTPAWCPTPTALWSPTTPTCTELDMDSTVVSTTLASVRPRLTPATCTPPPWPTATPLSTTSACLWWVIPTVPWSPLSLFPLCRPALITWPLRPPWDKHGRPSHLHQMKLLKIKTHRKENIQLIAAMIIMYNKISSSSLVFDKISPFVYILASDHGQKQLIQISNQTKSLCKSLSSAW